MKKHITFCIVFLGLIWNTAYAQPGDPGGGVDPDCVERSFFIDFGSPSTTTPSAGSVWNWNNVTNSVAGTTVNLTTRCGESSNVSIQIINSSDDGYGGITGNQFNTGGYNGEVGAYPASACVDSHFSYLTGGVYKLTGLLPDHFYTITIFGSRMVAATDRVGTYTFNKKQKTLDAANNTSHTVTFYYLKPSAQGELIMDFGVAPGSQFGYLNVMDIMETADPYITAPSALSAQATSMNGVLTWTDNTDSEQGFRIERKLSTQTLFQVVATVPANTTQYTDANLTPGNYDYRVFAYDDYEESAYSNEISLLVTEPVSTERRFLIDFGDPAIPTTISGWNNVTNSVTGTTVQLVTSQGTSSFVNVVIVKNSDDGYGNGNQFNSGGYNGTVLDYPPSACRDSHFSYGAGGQYKITGLNPARYYTIRIFGSRDVVAVDRKGTYTFNGKQLTLDAASNTSQTILFHYLKPSAQGELLLDFGVAPGSTFGYLNVMDIRERETPTIKEPLSLQASMSGLSVNLSWTDNSTNESGFRIERRVTGTALFQEVGQVGVGVTHFSETVAENAAGYEYRVFAYKNDENSAYSNPATTGSLSSVIPSAPNSLQRFVSGETVTLRWVNTAQVNNYTGVRIERRLISGSFVLAGEVAPGNTWFTETLTLSSSADTYEYRVYAYNGAGNSAYSNSVYVENFRIPTPEFIALKALYDNLGGNGWTRKTNWPATGNWPAYPNGFEYGTWEGVTVNGTFLNALDFHNNNLTGIIPLELWRARDLWYFRMENNAVTGFAEGTIDLNGMYNLYEIDLSHNQIPTLPDYLGTLPNLNRFILHHNRLKAFPQTFANHQQIVELDLSDNDLTSLPDFSGSDMLNSLNVANNNLNFGVLENVVDWGIQNLTYAPQKKLKSKGPVTFYVGELLVLDASLSGQFSSVTWEKQQPNGSWVNVNNLDEDHQPGTFTRISAGESDAGFYRWKITNSKVPGLELECEAFEVLKTSIENDLVYQYRYDARRRMTHKKIPGAAWVYMVYDDRDRLVMTQDGNQRNKPEGVPNEWTFTKYDALNRPVLTGIFKDSSKLNQAGMMQQSLNDFYTAASVEGNPDEWFEARGTPIHGYTNQSFPKVADENDYLTVTYYDDYDFKNSWGGVYAYVNEGLSNPSVIPFLRVTDQITGKKVKVLNTNTWLASVLYYDEKYNNIQTINDTQPGTKEIISNLYDFNGRILKTKNRIGSHTVTKIFEYDPAGRLVKTWHSVNEDQQVLLAKNEYNELGQLITKKLHNTDPPTTPDNSRQYKQHIDYRYNIRGWLSRINDASLSELDGGPRDYFGIEFAYNENLGGGNTPQYNGNISGAKWSDFSLKKQNLYNYTYDPFNRLTGASYKASHNSGAAWNIDLGRFNTSLTYDLNGNILSLQRFNGKDRPLDDLQYSYTGNRLDHVNEFGNPSQGFIEGNLNVGDYTYDSNGNVVQDLNKGIARMAYNYFNLTEEIVSESGDHIKYLYDANGNKLGQEVYNKDNELKEKSDYIGSRAYTNGNLSAITHDEGKVVIDNTGAAEYQYEIDDNVGNTRVVFTTKEDVDTYSTGFEDEHMVEEANAFQNYSRTRNDIFDHTDEAGTEYEYSQRLVGGINSIIGLAKSIEVATGDKIIAEAYAKYFNPSDASNNGFIDVAGALINAFQLQPGTVGDPSAFYSINDFFISGPAILAAGLFPWEDDNAPKAYVNILVFNKNYEIVDFAYDQIDAFAEQPLGDAAKGPHDLLVAEVEIKEPGYVYIYLSNENPELLEVYFDDVEITYKHSDVIQHDDFYAFGLSMTETAFQKDNSFYKGSSYQNFFGYEDLGFRRYDPYTGRFFSVDPLAELQLPESPYQFSKNNPVRYVDAQGLVGLDELLKRLLKNQKGGDGKPSGLRRLLTKIKNAVSTFIASLSGRLMGSEKAGNVVSTKRPKPPKHKKDKEKDHGSGEKESGHGIGKIEFEKDNSKKDKEKDERNQNSRGLLRRIIDVDELFPFLGNRKNTRPDITEDHNKGEDREGDADNNDPLTKELSDAYNESGAKANEVRSATIRKGGPVLERQLHKLNNDEGGGKIHKDQSKLGRYGNRPNEVLAIVDKIRQANADSAASVNITQELKAAENDFEYPVSLTTYTGRLVLDGKEVEVEIRPHGNLTDDNSQYELESLAERSDEKLAFGDRFGNYIRYTFNNAAGKFHHIDIIVPKEDAYAFEKYAGQKTLLDLLLEKEGYLTTEEIRTVRGLIEDLDEKELREEKYLKLQEKVPYHSQRDNANPARESMCNLTSEAMCLEMLGKDNPDPSKQFEDNLEDIRVKKKLPKRTLVSAREGVAKEFGVKVKTVEGTRGANREKLTKILLPHLKKGDGVMLSIGTESNGHLVRLQGITDEGLIVDDPYGEVDLIERSKGNHGYTKQSRNSEENGNRGEDNLWPWEDVEKAIIKYAEIYSIKK